MIFETLSISGKTPELNEILIILHNGKMLANREIHKKGSIFEKLQKGMDKKEGLQL